MVSERTEVKKTPVVPVPLRMRFEKTGKLQYISHLDLLRTMEHVVMRSGLPIRFSEGFNPHAKITFALPLSVGAESRVEVMDLQLTKPVDYTEAVRLLNLQLPPELAMYRATAGIHKVGDIGYAEYEMTYTYEGCREEDAEKLQNLYTHSLILMKRTKSGEKETDIAPMIRRIACKYEEGAIHINALLSAGGEKGYLNPEYLIKGAVQYLSLPLDDPEKADCRILRTEIYLCDGETVFA